MRSRSRTWAESDDTSQEDTKGAKRAHARRVPFVYIHIHIKELVFMWRLRIPVKSKSYHQTTRVSQQEELEGHPPHKDFTHSRPTVVTHWSHRLRGSVTFFNIPPPPHQKKGWRRSWRWRWRRRQHIPFLPAYGNLKSCELSFPAAAVGIEQMEESGSVSKSEKASSETDDSSGRERRRQQPRLGLAWGCVCVCTPHMYNSSAHLPRESFSSGDVASLPCYSEAAQPGLLVLSLSHVLSF